MFFWKGEVGQISLGTSALAYRAEKQSKVITAMTGVQRTSFS